MEDEQMSSVTLHVLTSNFRGQVSLKITVFGFIVHTYHYASDSLYMRHKGLLAAGRRPINCMRTSTHLENSHFHFLNFGLSPHSKISLKSANKSKQDTWVILCDARWGNESLLLSCLVQYSQIFINDIVEIVLRPRFRLAGCAELHREGNRKIAKSAC